LIFHCLSLSFSLPLYIYFYLLHPYISLRCGWVSLINWRESGWILINHNLKWFCNSIVSCISYFELNVITVRVSLVGGMLEWNYCCFNFKRMALALELMFTKWSKTRNSVSVMSSFVGPYST
jgi:hypothetical protein